MNRKQVIETLKMENNLICFDPLTGEDIPLEFVNDLNKVCYIAHKEAVRLINNSIPIEWIKKWLGGSRTSGLSIDVYSMLRDWEKENEAN